MKKSDFDTPQNNEPVSSFHTTREFIEALGIALVLAFLFKAFVIELYAIPTGSMGSTLMGRHKDVNCEVCGFPFQLGASREVNVEGTPNPRARNELPSVVGGTCPQCQYTMYVGSDNLAGQTYMSFNGDRIFVNKHLFSFREPSRWHVTVFRYPDTPQVNYIKRLIGLENETVMLRNGHVFVQKEGDDQFQIQRKPLRALLAMLRPVDDNDYVIPAIHELGWKTRWNGDEHWKRSADYKSFTGTGNADELSWLRFQYITATTMDWHQLIQDKLPGGNQTGTAQLVTDMVAFNTEILQYPSGHHWEVYQVETPQSGKVQLCRRNPDGLGYNWVGDLVVQGTLNVEKGGSGKVVFNLVKGGINFQCSLSFESDTTLAQFSIPEVPEFEPFSVTVPIRAGRKHNVMFCNVDEEMRLIIDGKEMDTQGRGRYDALCLDDSSLCRDRSPTAIDLEPAAIGVAGNLTVQVEHLKILRNLYYISCDASAANTVCDLIDSPFRFGFSLDYEESVKQILSKPEYWSTFGKTRRTTFRMEKDQFLMCGDNSAQSKDGRLWTSDGIPHYVDRELLIGEAVFVFWPHGLRIPGTRIALIPNFQKMRWID